MQTPAPVKNNTMALVSFISGIVTVLVVCLSSAVPFFSWVSLLGSLVAVITGFVAVGQIKKSNGAEKGRGLAITGIVLGIIFFLFVCLLISGIALLVPFLGDTFGSIIEGLGY